MSAERLSVSTLAGLSPQVGKPDYDIGEVGIGIVHLGLGAFHRAHQAVYTDAILSRDPGLGDLRREPQDAANDRRARAAGRALFGAGERHRGHVGARRSARCAKCCSWATSAIACSRGSPIPRVEIVSLTVTEKGYCHDPATGRINWQHPDIAHDVAHPDVAGEHDRRAGRGARGAPRGGRGRDHGRSAATTFRTTGARSKASCAPMRRPSIRRSRNGSARNVAFPCTMVDRIVPATTDDDVAEASRRLGVTDAAPVVAEPYTSWVIEDRFAGARPRWEDAGAQLVADVAPFETMKLRLLNGSHSTLAYLGFLAGYDFIWQASADPHARDPDRAADGDEVMPTLCGTARRRSRRLMVRRFASASVIRRCRTARRQIAMDGSQKLPQRLLATVRDAARRRRLDRSSWRSRSPAGFATRAAPTKRASRSWSPIRWRRNSRRSPAAAAGNASQIADGFLDLVEVFGADLSANAAFRRAVSRDVGGLFRDGVRRTLAVHIAHHSLVGRHHGRTAAHPASRPAVPGRSRHPRPCARALRDRRATCRS